MTDYRAIAAERAAIRAAKVEEIKSNMGEVLVKLEDWTAAQFADWYTPSPRTIKAFSLNFLIEMVTRHNMPLNTTYSEVINDWCIDEAFNDTFQD